MIRITQRWTASLVLLALAGASISAGTGMRHRCVVVATSATTEQGHGSHAGHGQPDQPAPSAPDESCDMYVSCAISLPTAGGNVENTELLMAGHDSREPPFNYYSPSIPTETPPPRA